MVRYTSTAAILRDTIDNLRGKIINKTAFGYGVKLVIPYTILSRILFPVNSRRGKKRGTRLFFMYTYR